MVSNFERILDEIRREAHQIGQNCGLEPEAIVTLIMEIVDLEDRNRVTAVAGINKRIKGMIESAARTDGTRGDA